MGHREVGCEEGAPMPVGWPTAGWLSSHYSRSMQAAHRGADPSSGVCEAPAWRGCLPELIHPCSHQREEVCGLGPGRDPRTPGPG